MTPASLSAYRRSVTRTQLAQDVALAAAMAGAMLGELWLSDAPDTEITPLSTVVIALAVAPSLVRRRHPALALVGCMGMLYVVLAVADCHNTVPFPSMLSGFSLALVVDRRRTILAGAALVPAVLLALGIYSPDGLIDPEVPKNLAFVAVPLLLGAAIRNRRAYLAALLDRAETAERRSEEEARRRVSEERLRIAQDVHDVVAHAIVAINVQAGVAAHLLDRDSEQARRTLLDIKRVSGEALGDLRATLGVLREGEHDAEVAPVRPQYRLVEVADLGEGLRSAGVEVELDLDAGVPDLPALVDATGYRIVQEALTNVLRHSGARSARVVVRRGEDHVAVEVTDDGGDRPVAAGSGTGNGLRGMVERAAAVGGTLEAGPRRGGGWRVLARLPLAASSPSSSRAGALG